MPFYPIQISRILQGLGIEPGSVLERFATTPKRTVEAIPDVAGQAWDFLAKAPELQLPPETPTVTSGVPRMGLGPVDSDRFLQPDADRPSRADKQEKLWWEWSGGGNETRPEEGQRWLAEHRPSMPLEALASTEVRPGVPGPQEPAFPLSFRGQSSMDDGRPDVAMDMARPTEQRFRQPHTSLNPDLSAMSDAALSEAAWQSPNAKYIQEAWKQRVGSNQAASARENKYLDVLGEAEAETHPAVAALRATQAAQKALPAREQAAGWIGQAEAKGEADLEVAMLEAEQALAEMDATALDQVIEESTKLLTGEFVNDEDVATARAYRTVAVAKRLGITPAQAQMILGLMESQ